MNSGDSRALFDDVLNEVKTADVQELKNCAYTQQTTIKDVGSMRERYDPSGGLGLEWQLLQVNGKNPTDQQVHNYDPKKRQRHPAVLNFDFIDVDSLQLLEESQSKLKLEYKVVPGAGQGLNQHVTNQLTIDSDTGQLLEVKSIALETFRIQRWTQVKVYENVSTFRFEDQTNGTVLEQITLKLELKSRGNTLNHEVTKKFFGFCGCVWYSRRGTMVMRR
ncbi:MAG: hypothetical protein F4227_05330, partial [Gammaproteobacteria bacterium]|nr:hypothetical protein [Gammaproteobacteria bacterium]